MVRFNYNFNTIFLLLHIQTMITVVNLTTTGLEILEREFQVSPDISVDLLLHGNATVAEYRQSLYSIGDFLSPVAHSFLRILPTSSTMKKAFPTENSLPSILYVLPSTTQEHLEFMLQLNVLQINLIDHGLWKIWKPIIYIKWPNPVSESELRELRILSKFGMDWQIYFSFKSTEESTLLDFHNLNNVPILQKVELNSAQPLTRRRASLQGHLIRATAVNDSDNLSMVSYRRSSSGELEFARGSSVWLLNDLRDSLNFTLEATESDAYISQLPNGSIGGIGRQLANQEADIAIPLSYVLPYRQKALTALHPLCVDKFLVFFRQPPASSVRYIFTQPFSAGLWASLTLIWLLVQFSILTFNHFQKKEWNNDEIAAWDSSLLFVIAMISQQGWHESPHRFSGKVIFICGLFTGLLPFLAYSASIVSVLSATVVPVKGFEDLVNMKFVLLADPLIDFGKYLAPDRESSSTNSGNVQQMLDKNYVNGEDSVVKVLKGGHAFINTLDFFSPIARSLNYSDPDICEQVSWVRLPSVTLAMAFHVPKDSIYKELFNVKILLTLERGLNHRYISTLYTETRVQCDQRRNKSSQEELGIRDMFTAFTLIGCSHLASLLLLILEKLVVFRNEQKILKLKIQLLIS